jgi:hypothetical protein
LPDIFSNFAIQLLRVLRDAFPDRRLLVVDYLGRLGRARGGNNDYQAVLQDLVQALSGQGIPPPDLKGWSDVYEAAGVRLTRVWQGPGSGLEWFIHDIIL